MCGGKVSKPGLCSSCACKTIREFNIKCTSCGESFKAKTNKPTLCIQCKPKTLTHCVDCGVIKKSARGTRCNSCSAKNRSANGKASGGWDKYEVNGIKFRSKWEVRFAEILWRFGVEFKYEMFHKQTMTRPDFYICELDRFVEIHPDFHGVKDKIPENCVLVKTENDAEAMAYAICMGIKGDIVVNQIMAMGSRRAKYLLARVDKLATYLRQAIEEQKK
ncbi:MAG: hypothetical protein ACRCVX_01450 [Shewanella sp.]